MGLSLGPDPPERQRAPPRHRGCRPDSLGPAARTQLFKRRQDSAPCWRRGGHAHPAPGRTPRRDACAAEGLSVRTGSSSPRRTVHLTGDKPSKPTPPQSRHLRVRSAWQRAAPDTRSRGRQRGTSGEQSPRAEGLRVSSPPRSSSRTPPTPANTSHTEPRGPGRPLTTSISAFPPPPDTSGPPPGAQSPQARGASGSRGHPAGGP